MGWPVSAVAAQPAAGLDAFPLYHRFQALRVEPEVAQRGVVEQGRSVGGSKLLRQSAHDRVTIVAAGVTVHEALAAADSLAADGTPARVVDLYSVKPVDASTLHRAAADTGHLVIVEDHRPEGGLGDAVLDAFTADVAGPLPRVVRLAVRNMPASATPAEQLQAAAIDAEAIAAAARRLLAMA